ncbi:MAG: transglycosylase domain-containing protein [Ramlibacter sp.]
MSLRAWGLVRRHPLITAAAVPMLLVLYVVALIPFTPTIKDIQKAKTEQPTVVLSADGQELAVFKRANRDWVKLADISPSVIEALIATEDHRFFKHHGMDLQRTLSAALHTARGELQGGSTITQQLARNLYPDEVGRAATITRKVKEAITALKIEAVYSKNEILESYLNTVPFLYNAYGIEMAARTYFDKSAHELGELESATLIGMLKGTSYYNPVLNPERSVQRRNTVLAQMVKHQKMAPARLEELKKKPLGLEFERQSEPVGPAPHITQQLRRWLIEWADRNGYNINADGLVVHTTIDSRLQEQANQAMKRQADKLQALADGAYGKGWAAHKDMTRAFLVDTAQYRAAKESGLSDADALKKLEDDTAFMQALWHEKTQLQSGFLALDPNTGHVKAWVGSRSFEEEKFDHVNQARRQPGSTFKPFVYGAAFEQGINPLETLMDQPVEIRLDERTVWKPTDVSAATGRAMTLREGLIFSKNTITSQLMMRVGPSRVASVAYNMGVRQSKLDLVPSLALGTSPVTLKEMVTAFGSIANGGSYVEPILVTRVENRYRSTLQAFDNNAPAQALSNVAAQTLLDVMRGVIDQGTGAGIRSRFGIQADVAGKTGTTQDNTDGWFIMMHPHLVAGAWVGFNDNRVTMRGDWGQGARNALNIVGDFYQQAFKSKVVDPNAKFLAPHQPTQDPLLGRMNNWLNSVFQPPPQQEQVDPGSQPLPVGSPAYEAQNFPRYQRPDFTQPDPRPDFTQQAQRPQEAYVPQAVAPQRPDQPARVIVVGPDSSIRIERQEPTQPTLPQQPRVVELAAQPRGAEAQPRVVEAPPLGSDGNVQLRILSGPRSDGPARTQ